MKSLSKISQPDVLSQSGEWVTVTIIGVADPSDGDFIAVYSPSNVDITQTSPVKTDSSTLNSQT